MNQQAPLAQRAESTTPKTDPDEVEHLRGSKKKAVQASDVDALNDHLRLAHPPRHPRLELEDLPALKTLLPPPQRLPSICPNPAKPATKPEILPARHLEKKSALLHTPRPHQPASLPQSLLDLSISPSEDPAMSGDWLGEDPLDLWGNSVQPPALTAQDQDPAGPDEDSSHSHKPGAWADAAFAQASLFGQQAATFEPYTETGDTRTDESKPVSASETTCSSRGELEMSTAEPANPGAALTSGPAPSANASLALLADHSRESRSRTASTIDDLLATSLPSSPFTLPLPPLAPDDPPISQAEPPAANIPASAAGSTGSDSTRHSPEPPGSESESTRASHDSESDSARHSSSASASALLLEPLASFAPDEDESSHQSGFPQSEDSEDDEQRVQSDEGEAGREDEDEDDHEENTEEGLEELDNGDSEIDVEMGDVEPIETGLLSGMRLPEAEFWSLPGKLVRRIINVVTSTNGRLSLASPSFLFTFQTSLPTISRGAG
ncbi:hypothetical protein BDK51DRAFT_37308 [Blyttiomyces helicus]|uniref:Uncharacterized protein n=1 Tax=Blyttiomyces helicus TaxID=388810 RepID=A0A4V1IS15_9FUNG|nr:hypothetical protein BDK51DRAFT_37308 [Blyttiomyces helicus]|eukprot:RKO91977.1 hypothetical protein BDK51DRAFT_37308 [Blyttiomyces helicus]